jgi:peptidoglycan/xylan/chitin deacetylase (PgdA/CDA1 family)
MFIASVENETVSNQFQYIIKTFSQIYRIPCQILRQDELQNQADNGLLISYGKKLPTWQGKHIHIYESAFFGEEYLTAKSLPCTPLPRYNDLPVLYLGGEGKEPFINRKGNLIETNIDLIASSFFMLTRYEEVVNNEPMILDAHERFPATASIAYKENFLHRPVVNEYFKLLWNCIKELVPHLEKKSLWGDKDFALCLTHDIDNINSKLLTELLIIGSLLLKQHSLTKATARFVNNIMAALRRKNAPFDTFSKILRLEQKYGATSSFFFMTEPDNSGGYFLDNCNSKDALNKVLAAGSEIGLHAGYYSYNDQKIINKQKATLTKITGQNDIGCRQHYLRWKTPDTWRIHEKCGLSYDTTLCFADHEGFRAGICHPFQPFDIKENRILNLWEIPLTIMDGTLFNYRKLSPMEGLLTIESYIATVKKHQGILVLLWHNSFFDQDIYPGWTNTYEDILASAISKNALLVSAGNTIKLYLEPYKKEKKC